MKLSLPIKLPKLFGAKVCSYRVGIALHAKFVRLVKGNLIDGLLHYHSHDEVEIDGEDQWVAVLKELIKKHQLDEAHCCLVIPGNRYQMLQIDKPGIPEEEIVGALAWSIKDLVAGIPPEDIVADFMQVPTKPQGQGDKINVVVTSNKTIQPLIEVFHDRNIVLDAVLPEELSLRNVLDTSASASLLITSQKGEEVILQIIKQDELYIARKLRGFNRIHLCSIEDLEQGVIENLYLEIQRSMDFFDSQLKQAPVKNVLVALPCIHQQSIIEQFSQLFKVGVDVLSVNHPSVVMDDPLSEQFFPALGGALECLLQVGLVNEQ